MAATPRSLSTATNLLVEAGAQNQYQTSVARPALMSYTGLDTNMLNGRKIRGCLGFVFS